MFFNMTITPAHISICAIIYHCRSHICIKLSSQSPDINLIEDPWDELTMVINKKETQHHTTIHINRIHIMPKRCWTCREEGQLRANYSNVQWVNVTKMDISNNTLNKQHTTFCFLTWIYIFGIPCNIKNLIVFKY